MMKKLILIFIAILALGIVPASAQKKEAKKCAEWEQEMLTFKLKFLAQEMDLREDQKARFNELYKAKQEERSKLFREAGAALRQVKNNKNATDADYERASEAMDNARAKGDQIDKLYDEKFKTFLSSKQIFKMKEAEDKFRQKLREMHGKNKFKKKKAK